MKHLLAWTIISTTTIFAQPFHPLSDEFIAAINNRSTTWSAGRNFAIDTPLPQIRKLLGVLPKTSETPKLPLKIHEVVPNHIPEFFDAREAWPNCKKIIGDIRDQASCSSCWAFAAVEAMSDRICIHSKGKKIVSVSAEDLLDCCDNCGFGCNGGYTLYAWYHWNTSGIVTGGKYGTKDGCKAYSIPPCNHNPQINGTYQICDDNQATPKCTLKCDPGTNLDYNTDKTRGSGYSISNNVTQIQIEIMTNGPVEAEFVVYSDFVSYKNGVYQHVKGDMEGGHAVKIIGWGVENKVPYWLVTNSWNEYWGDHGFFKILRGSNECFIENGIVAGIPFL